MNYEISHESWIPIGKRLVEVRGNASQSEMSRVLSISKSTYSRLERGAREIGADVLTRLEALGWNPTWVLTGRGTARGVSAKGNHPAGSDEDAQRGEDVASSTVVDPDLLALAIELADDVVGAKWLPTGVYARLVTALYQAAMDRQSWSSMHTQARLLLAELLADADQE